MKTNERMRKVFSILLCLCMVLQYVPTTAFAVTTAEDGLCDHHTEHTAECGYVEAVVGVACGHEHSEDCYAIVQCIHEHDESCGTDGADCTHECTVDNGCVTMALDCHHTHGDCGYSEGTAEVPCGHQHDGSCGYVEAVAEVLCACTETDESGALIHAEGCGYVAPVEGVACGHTEHTDCGYAAASEGTPCTHTHSVIVNSDASCYDLLCSHKEVGHDDTCGYVAAVEAHECHYECAECAAALTVDETTEPSTEPAPVCTCGTDDPAIHATNCAVYVAPENPVCTCVEKCTEANVWCDVCGFDYTACTGTDEAIAYEDTTACAHSFGDSGVCTACGITGGYCGASTNTGGVESVTWTLADDGTLTISGTGAMADYAYYYEGNKAPWDSDRDSIKTVKIIKGVTSIGEFAFTRCTALKSITIPDSVTSIGNGAFAENTFTSITIPNGVESIGVSAFAACRELKSITIPDSVTSIGESAFYGNWGLTDITLSANISIIDIATFYGCSSLTSITIPDGVTSIGEYAFFDCGELKSITIPGSVTSIGSKTFTNCIALTTITANCKWKTYFPNYENIDTFTHTLVDGEYFASGNKIYYKCENGCTYDSLVAARLELASDDAIYYTGSAITPEVKVTYVNGASAETLPLTVSKCEYSNNTEPGTATCTVTYQEGYVLTLDFTINKIKPTVSALPTVADRVYDPSVALQNSDLIGGTVYDEKNNILSGTWSWQEAKIPEVNNSGYVAVFTPTDNVHYDTATETITVNVVKATPTATVTANTPTYNGQAQALINASTTGGTLQYKVDDGEWSTELPKATNAGTYTVYYEVVGNDNYNAVAEQSITVTIAKATPEVTAPTAVSGLIYSGEAQTLINAGNTTAGTMQYSLDNATWSTELPKATNAGTYTVYYEVVGNDNYNAVAEQSITVTIAKATPEVTAPTAVSGLIYSGEAQTLINAGNTTAGTMQYSLDNATWSTELPKATNAGIHTVYYKVVGNDNYNDAAETSFTVTIACDHTHNTNTEYKAVPGTNTHSMICSVCEEAISTGDHSGGTATCSHGKFCETCGSEYGEVDTTNHVAFDEKGFCPNCGEYEPATDSDGDGYYEIDNAGKLYWFANLVNGGTSKANAVLTKNITVNQNLLSSLTHDANGNVTNGDSFRIWIPIGNNTNNYTGTFDGNNKTVSGLYFNDSDTDDVGLFGRVGSGGTVKNVGVIDSYLSGRYWVGGVVGNNCGTVANCYNTGSISGSNWVGGVVGENKDTVESCYNAGSVSGGFWVGGVVAWNDSGTVTNCYYLSGTAAGGIDSTDVTGSAEAKTAAQFASGEVTWLLNGSTSEGELVWYQTIGTDAYPQFTGSVVYYDSVNGYYNHVHNWTYSKDDNKITATCDAADCTNTDGGYVTIAVPDSLTYTGSKIEAVVENTLTTGDTVTVEYTGDTTEGYPVNAGEYTAKITLDGKEISVTYEIAAVSIEGASVSVSDAVYTGTAQKPTVTVKLGDKTLTEGTDYSVAFPADMTNAGEYTITVTGKGNYSGSKTVEFTISKVTLTVTADNKTMTTGYALPDLTYTITGFVNGENESVLTTKPVAETSTDGETAGTFEITVSGAEAANYAFTYVNGTLSVVDHQHNWTYTAKDGTITAKCGNAATCPDAEQSITISTVGKTYDGTPVTATLTGAIDGVTTPTISYSGNTNAGTHTASITMGEGENAVTASVEFTIAKAKLTVTAYNRSITYGGAPENGGVSYEGFVNNETESVLGGSLEYEYTYANGNDVGNYTITPKGLTSDNYEIEFVAGTLYVLQADPAYTAPNAKSLTYNGQAQELVTAGKTNHGEMQYSLVENGTYGSDIPTGTNAGSYTVYYKVVGDKNHNDVAAQSVEVTISPKTITELTFVGLNEVYAHTGSAVEPEFTVKDGDTTLTVNTDYTVAFEDNTDVGTATITINLKGNYEGSVTKNFEIKTHVHEWSYALNDAGDTITATCKGTIGTCPDAEQSVTLNASDAVYSGEMVQAKVTKDGTDLTYTLRYTGTGYDSENAPINAGTYKVTMTVGDKSVSDTFTISPKNIANCTVGLTKSSFVYSGEAPELTVTAVDNGVGSYTMKAGTDYTVGTVAVNAGNHKLTVTGAGNYTGTVKLDYTITAKEVTITGAEIEGVTYANSYTLTVTGVTFDGVVEGETLDYTATAALTGTNAVGDQEATVTVVLKDSNYTLATATYKTTVNISKADAAVTAAPTAKELTYTGSAQELVTVGKAKGGEMQYSLDGTNYSTTIPTGTDAETYTVYYYVKGDNNHNDTTPDSLTVTIGKANPNIGTVSYSGKTLYESTDISTVALSRSEEAIRGMLVLTDEELTVGEETYNWKFTPEDSKNYNTITGTVKLTVQEDTLQSITTSGTLTKSAYTYGDTFSIAGLTVTATYTSGATKDVTKSVTFNETLAVGQTSVELTYQGKTCEVTGITVVKKQLVISDMSWDVPEDAVYNNTAYTATLNGTLPEGVKVDVSGNTGTNAGDYTAKAVFSLADGYSADNYEIVNGGDLTAQWSIAKKNIANAEITLGTALTYNGSVQTQTVTNVEIDGLTVTYDVSGNTGTDAKDYTLTVTGTGNFEGTATKTWSIAKKNITGAAITLGTALTYNGGEQTMEVTEVKIDGLTVTYNVTDNKQTNAGSYTLTVTGNGNFEGSATADWSIGKAALTVTAKDHTITYGNEPSANGVSYDGFVSSENETMLGGELTYSYNYEQYGNVGTYTITPSGLTSNNYTITFKTGKLTVNAKEITVTANAVSKTYGDADPELTYKVVGLVNGDKLSGSLTRAAGTDVGTYAITQGTLTAGSNYTINYTGATLTINKKPITEADVTLNGSLTYTGSEQTQEVTVTEGITYEVSGNKETNVGTYELTVKGTGNYTGEVKLSWSIKEATAIVDTAPTANNLTYNGEDQALVTAGTTTDGTMMYKLGEDGEYTNNIPTGNAAGDYIVWYYVKGDANHADSAPASVSVKIKKAAADYEDPAANTLTYNGSTQALVTEGTTADGTMMYKLGEDGAYSETIPTAANAGTYTVYYYVKGDSNHNNSAAQKIEVTIGQLDITGKTVDITLAGSLTYNGAEQTMGVSSVKLDALTVTYTVSGNKGTNADSYVLTVTGTGNFKGTATKEWSIAQKSVTVTAKDQTITYGETISGTEITAAGLVDGHSVTATLTPSTANVTVSGTITADAAVITADGTDVTANYDISYTSGKLVIEPDTSKIDALTTENVTSANEEDVKAVQAMMASAETDGIDEATAAQWAAITAKCEDLIDKIEAVEAENARIADAAADFDLNTVKSSDEAAITALIADIDEQLATNNLTDEERSELEGLKTKCNNLIAKIDGTETLIAQLDKTVDDLDAETVKSTDKATLEQVIADAQTLIDSGNITEAEKEALKQTQEDAKALIKVIDDTAAENKALTDQAATFDEDTVKSTDKAELEQLAQDIEDLLDTQNLTEDERTNLEAVLEQVEGMIDTINETAEDSKAATDTIDALDPATVTSDDKDELEQAIATIDELLKDDHLTEEERSALIDAKADAEALIDVIEAAQDATDTENTEKVEDVTAENVKPEDKEALEDAKADLEKALEDNAGNYTEEEKKAIEDEIQRIEDAITALENVEDVTETITQLPETVEPDDEETAEKILDAKKAYDELTDHEKSLVDETTKEKLEGLVAALTDYKIIKGNGGKWTKGSSSGLSFTANGPFSKFVGIEVDGKEVASTYYTAESGSTIITLKQSFLKRLSTGEHTIAVLYTDGEASGTFKILAQSTSPATGDDSNIMLWSGMLCVSTLGLVVLLADRKRRKATK